jgi:DNA-binding GntR family transcriptional regulator
VIIHEFQKPRYVVLAESIIELIQNDHFPITSLLPTEPELCEKFNVSRYTLRESMKLLREMGLIQSRQGYGITVVAKDIKNHYQMKMDSIPDLWEFVENSKLNIVNKGKIFAGETLAKIPNVQNNDEWIVIEATREIDETTPIAWKHIYIKPKYKNVIKKLGKDKIPIYSMIEKEFGIRTIRVQQEMSALTIPNSAAESLHLEKNSIGFQITRYYYDQSDQVFLTTVSIYPPNRFNYKTELVLSS